MADNRAQPHAAVLVEDEPPHEIYANLIEEGGSRPLASSAGRSSAREAADRSIMATSRRTRPLRSRPPRHGSSDSDGNVVEIQGDASLNLIPADERCRVQSESQFIAFYRKSCQERQRDDSGEGSGTASGEATRTCNSKKATKCAAKHTLKSPTDVKRKHTTKSERRRMARRERERHIRNDKRVRIMLRSDFSEEDELLYRGLTR
ncbi:hypothetical protein ACHAWF_017300 [Thalassiosira exigua]